MSSAPGPCGLNPIAWLWKGEDAIFDPRLVESVFYSSGFWLNVVISVRSLC